MEAKELYIPYEFEQDGKTVVQVVHYQEFKDSPVYLAVKRFLDIILALPAIILLSPLMGLISFVIILSSEGPAIYKQKRIGKNGNIFTIYKFRTMVDGAEQLAKHLPPDLIEFYKINRKIQNDPRITKFGSLLRKTSLDELPQLLNVLAGDMSLVGPRPMMPDEIQMYGSNFEHYITVKPGLTGLWQIKCRSMTTMQDRALLDREYIKRKNFRFDLIILIKTVGVVFSKKGAC